MNCPCLIDTISSFGRLIPCLRNLRAEEEPIRHGLRFMGLRWNWEPSCGPETTFTWIERVLGRVGVTGVVMVVAVLLVLSDGR